MYFKMLILLKWQEEFNQFIIIYILLEHSILNGRAIIFKHCFNILSCSSKIAEWLTDDKKPAVCLKIDENFRPVKLRKVVLGFPCSGNQTEFKFDLTLNYKIASVIQTYSEQKPALVVCFSLTGFKNVYFAVQLIQKVFFYL